jgi:hypothetical protein
MKVRRRLTGVLYGFLDTFTSRYSDYDGYWIFGLLVREGDEVSLNLLHTNSNFEESVIISAATGIARAKFNEIRQKFHIPAEFVSEGRVLVSKLEPATLGLVNGRTSKGHLYSVCAEATSDLGKKYTARKTIFIAPHDPAVEHRSTQRNH